MASPRTTVLAWTFWAAAVGLAILAVMYSGDVHSETYSAVDRAGNRATLYEEPCASGLEWLKQWKRATLMYHGQQYEAFWRVVGGYVVLLDSAGDLSPIQPEAFKKDETL